MNNIKYTDRLLIRITSLSDVDLLLKMDKQYITQKFLGGIKNKTKEERINFLNKKIDKYKNGLILPFTICLKDNTPIGFIDIKLDNNEISFIFDEDYTNQGFCTEASIKIINDLKLNVLNAYILKDNYSSKRVIEKLGFKYQKNVIKDNNIFLLYKLEK